MIYRYRFKKEKVRGTGKVAIATFKLIVTADKTYLIDVALASIDESIFPSDYADWLTRHKRLVRKRQPITLPGTATEKRHKGAHLTGKLLGAEGEKHPTPLIDVDAFFCDEALQTLGSQKGGWIAVIGRTDLKKKFTVSETKDYLVLDIPDPSP